ncbi:MAG TPA: TnsA endonuclease N-terminal domain-containing protein [Longimicrobium sp.]
MDKWNSELCGADYRPALTVRSFGSRGKSIRIAGHTTGRVHHFFSMVEESAFLLYDWLPDVSDIREQYALELDVTQAIAFELGIAHITDRKSGKPHPVTTDLVLSRRVGSGEVTQVRSCKRSGDLGGSRTLQKLEIERQYWLRRGIEWKLVTERDLPDPLIRNLRWLHPFVQPSSVGIASEHLAYLIKNLHRRIQDQREKSLAYICTECDRSLGTEPGGHLALARHAVASRQWRVDLHAEIDPSRPLLLRDDTSTEAS